MRKKIAIILALSLFLIPVTNLSAEEKTIKSYGNIDVENGVIKIYSEDIEYLQQEINILLQECMEG